MKSICADGHMPDVWTVWHWRQTNPEFSQLIQRAREAQSEAMLDACQELADEAAKLALDPECGSASVAAKKLAIETRLKVAARFAPENSATGSVRMSPAFPARRWNGNHPGPRAAGPAAGR